MVMDETIVAVATPQGEGAIGIIRISGNKTFEILEKIFYPIDNKKISQQKGSTIHFGEIKEKNTLIDEVLVSVFKNPKSYTGEDVAEISCHASEYILSKIIQLVISNGARLSNPGEFTLRAYLNGKIDLSQAEAIADLISSENEASHKIAIQQMRGGYSKEISKLREELINFSSLIELELDFSEEDVEFADRKKLIELLIKIKLILKGLIDSFKMGNAIKQGVPIAIVGQPNSGKSSLLNSLLNEEKSIISEIEGTTRDVIEDILIMNGVKFRFLDTAGIRDTEDKIEILGIEKSFKSIEKSEIILYIIDLNKNYFQQDYKYIEKIKLITPDKDIILVGNKKDLNRGEINYSRFNIDSFNIVEISAMKNQGIDFLKNRILEIYNGKNKNIKSSIIISNARHYEHFLKAYDSLKKVEKALNSNISGDLISIDIKDAIYHLGQITGQIDMDTDILGNIFSKFCIGK